MLTASSNSNWQQAAGGAAAPCFGLFNPALQTKKCDRRLQQVKKWIAELNTPCYPAPVAEQSLPANAAPRLTAGR